jgi:hypothetical protein
MHTGYFEIFPVTIKLYNFVGAEETRCYNAVEEGELKNRKVCRFSSMAPSECGVVHVCMTPCDTLNVTATTILAQIELARL